MKRRKYVFEVILLSISFLILILDAKTALQGAKDGIELCIYVVIPSLFPFLFLSAMLPERLLGKRIPFIGNVAHLCGIPKGAESLLLLGLLGGYPVGAGMITEAYKKGNLSKSAAERMLGFCNNAGPAFIFGMVGALFENKQNIWVLWLIHILSALVVGMILPGKTNEDCTLTPKAPKKLSQSLEISVKTMATICGWVIIFRVIVSFFDRWLLWMLPIPMQAMIIGLIELSNGISFLHNISHTGIRFILCSGMLAFGGLCVSLQTASVTRDMGTGLYFPGKVLQCLLSLILTLIAQHLLLPLDMCIVFPLYFYIFLLLGTSVLIFSIIYKKSSSISCANIV